MKKKKAHKMKVGDVPTGWVRPLFTHDKDDCLMYYSPLSTLLGKRGNTLHAPFAARKFPSTNTARRLPGNTCINTTLPTPVTLRQLCSWQSNVGRKGGTSLRKGFPALCLVTLGGRSNVEDYRLQSLRQRPCACKRNNGIQLGGKGC